MIPFLSSSRTILLSVIVMILAGFIGSVHAQNTALSPSAYREIDTKYIFGFTTGTGIGLEGEKEISSETIAALGKRSGKYQASETKFEFEHTPTQYMQFEIGALAASHNIRGVPGLDDRQQFAFSGLFGELRYLAIERGATSPFAVTLSVEPVWRRIDETSGDPVRSFELETRIAVDTELVPNQVYFGFNALYEPGWTRTADGNLEKEATLGVSSALAFRPLTSLVVGAEIGYFRHYDSLNLSQFVGDAWFVGPTLYWQFARKAFMTAAWATQVSGHSTEDPGTLNLHDFSRHRAKLKLAFEF